MENQPQDSKVCSRHFSPSLLDFSFCPLRKYTHSNLQASDLIPVIPALTSIDPNACQSVLDELTRRGGNVRIFVQSSTWLNVPAVLRSWKKSDTDALLVQLLTSVNSVLIEVCTADIPIANERLLHSSLSSLSQNHSLPKNVRMWVDICLATLKSVVEGPFILMEREEVRAMESTLEKLSEENKELKKQNEQLKEKGLEEKEKQTREFDEMMKVLREERERQLQTLDEAHKVEEARKREELVRQTLRFGGQAIEFVSPSITRYGNTFSHSTSLQTGSLLSFEFGSVVARFTFILGTQQPVNTNFGIVAHFQTAAAIHTNFASIKGGAAWTIRSDHMSMYMNNTWFHQGTACLEGSVGQKIVLEADGREGKRTLKLSQDGETQPTFFSHIPVPFRFAVAMLEQRESVTIVSLEVLDEPQMGGGTIEVPMDE
ncbi:hypothetical protein BLNAU_5221 [Blattamonas nauphoetae]|uniref:Uncharacterized protein n=1 Tax=Blattamonas nauphoetae TaxID=2049346 RepID=A0ABQ9Y7J0_9EUKA|nr:hypothetical protein BLNAU_5221 [Blattamonas nauphoetae]